MYLSFHQALLESTVEQIIKTEFPGVPCKIKETKTEIQLIIFVIPFKERRKGKATEFINRLQELAEIENKNIVLTADDGYLTDEQDMNLEQLRAWYKKLGFKRQTGKFDHIYKP
jgi:archaellum biogenesis ATPase FlaH